MNKAQQNNNNNNSNNNNNNKTPDIFPVDSLNDIKANSVS